MDRDGRGSRRPAGRPREGDPIDRDLFIGSLAALALVLLCALHPIEIHPEAAAGSGVLLVLCALMLPRLDATRILAASLPVAALLLPVAGLSLAFSRAPHASAVVLARSLLLAIVGLSLAAVARARGGARLLATLAAGLGVLAALHAIWQGCTGFAALARAAEGLPEDLRALVLARLGSGRVFGPFELPASLGGALAITLPLTLALALVSAGRRRAAWIAAGLAQLVALIWSISLGAWIALAAASVLVLAAPLVRVPRGRRALAAGVALAALLVAAGLFARARVLPAPGPEDRPLTYRSGNWTVAAAIVADHPLVGTGPGTYGVMFPVYRREGMNESRYAHCTYLQLVAELGIGVVPFLVLVPLGAWVLVRRGARGGAIGVAASTGALAFLLQNLVDFTFYQPSVGALFVLACAIAASGPEGAPAAEPEGRAPAPAGRWSAAHAVVLVASVATGIFLFASGISELSRERAAFAHEVGRLEEASLLARAVRWDPWDPAPHGDLANLLLARAQASGGVPAPEELEEARAQARAASRLDPQTAFRRRDLARIELTQGHPAAAWVEIARAASLYPLKEEYRKDLADLETRLFAPALEDAHAPDGSKGAGGGKSADPAQGAERARSGEAPSGTEGAGGREGAP